MRVLAQNKRAFFDYHILEKIEAGVVLTGPETKSVKKGQISLKGGYVTIQNEEAYLSNISISPYPPAKEIQKDYNPKRKRKLLLKKKEIKNLIGKIHRPGLTVLPLRVYTKDGLIKVELGVVKGKRKEDKRELIKKRELEKKIRQVMKRKRVSR